MIDRKEQNTMTNSSQNSFLMMAALASALSMTTTPIYAHEEQALVSVVVEQTYDYSTTYVQEIRYTNPDKKNFRERYARMVKSEWFQKAYNNKSVGDIIEVDY